MMHVFRFLAIMSLLAPFAYASDSAALREELPAWLIVTVGTEVDITESDE